MDDTGNSGQFRIQILVTNAGQRMASSDLIIELIKKLTSMVVTVQFNK